mgnify:FL=1
MVRFALEALAKTIGRTVHPEKLFTGWQSLLGFKIGWALPAQVKKLYIDFYIDPKNSEVIMMQATGLTECHMHKTGATTFMVLGREHGIAPPSGGTFMGDFDPTSYEQKLELIRHRSGEVFTVPAGKIHAFAADLGGSLTLIGIVNPKIRTGNEFDVVPFDYVSQSDPSRVRLKAA